MVVYLNGGFGVGKTTVALLLVAALRNAVLFDPESVGAILRDTLSAIDPRDDFQSYVSWPVLVEAFVRELREAHPSSCVVVPMSILNEECRRDV
ncbi:MAG TPA: hypothetical protein VGF18_05480, partial [Candidatus Tumulicola sp.]